jgi:hypothetical protein
MAYRLTARAVLPGALALGLTLAPASLPARAGPPARASQPMGAGIRPVIDISGSCRGQNAEVEQAADSTGRHIYEAWLGCRGIGFARSTDGGLSFREPLTLPASSGAWDPSLAVAPDGVVYAAFMKQTRRHMFPVVDASFDHGRTFAQVARLVPQHKHNFGDRVFVAAAPNGTAYLTWDYGPSASAVSYTCTKGGGCGFAAGDLNIVMQKSNDFGLTWGRMTHVSPGFPAGGADSAPLLVEPGGRIDLEYQGYRVTDPAALTLGPAHGYFTSSADGGATWSHPARIGPGRLSMSTAEWWVDGAIGRDTGGYLYVTWDSQRPGRDVGWLSYSTDGGATWSHPARVTPDRDSATHIVEVAGGPRGIAYVGWLADNSRCGYALYVRTFSVFQGWLSGPVRVSRRCGRRHAWPGGTFGLTALPPYPAASGPWELALSWASAAARADRRPSEIFSAVVTVPGGD